MLKSFSYLLLLASVGAFAFAKDPMQSPQLAHRAKVLNVLSKYLSEPKKVNRDLIYKSHQGKAIYQSDIGSSGLLLNNPGDYYLAENVFFQPTVDNLQAIVIGASDVKLCLNNKTLTQTGPATGVIGILVDGVSNVTISGGNVVNFSQYGIAVNPGSSFVKLDRVGVSGSGVTDPSLVGSVTGGGIALFIKHREPNA